MGSICKGTAGSTSLLVCVSVEKEKWRDGKEMVEMGDLLRTGFWVGMYILVVEVCVIDCLCR